MIRNFWCGVYRGLCVTLLLITTAVWLVASIVAAGAEGATTFLDNEAMR